MLSNELAAVLKPFGMISSHKAMSPSYKTLELSPDRLKAESHYALLESSTSIGIPTTAYVDTTAFVQLVASMPPGHEVTLSAGDSTLRWRCSSASGRLALLPAPEMAEFPELTRSVAKSSEVLANALDLAGISCDNAALGAIGVYGIVVHNNTDTGNLIVCSTDNFSVSACKLSAVQGIPEWTTLSPLGAELLATIMHDGKLFFSQPQQGVGDWLIYRALKGGITCLIRGVPPLSEDADPVGVVNDYTSDDLVAKIPRERIAAFLHRINALSDNRRYAKVVLGAVHGNITLAFEEGAASSEEYIIADTIEVTPEFPSISVPAMKLARVLSHTDEIVLDYVESARKMVILRSQDRSFTYYLVGQEVRPSV